MKNDIEKEVKKLLENILANLFSSAISAGVIWLVGVLRKAIQNQDEAPVSRKKHSRRLVEKQFFVCLICLPLFIITGLLLPAPLTAKTPLDVLFMFGRVTCFIIAFYSFIFAWGAFSAALEFYPPDPSPKSTGSPSDDIRPDKMLEVQSDKQANSSAGQNS